MKHTASLALLICLAVPAAAQTDLKCPELRDKVRAVRTMRMEPVRRGKEWLEGTPKSVATLSCGPDGLKTEEAEYEGKAVVLSSSFTYNGKEGTNDLCEKLLAQKDTDEAPADAHLSVKEFCRNNLKKDISAALVYDSSPSSQGRESAKKPVRQIFRLYGKKGLVDEEDSFDMFQSLESVTLYTYDKTGELSGLTVKDPDGRQLKREAFARDKATSSRTRSEYDENNELRQKTVYELRETGALRRETRSTYDAGDQVVARTEIYSDEKGSPEKELVYDADGADPKYEYSYAYKYDARDNWTQERKTRVIVYNGNRLADTQYAPEITNRTISYY